MKGKNLFLFFWSLFSGYGIIFAIESWTLELLQIHSYLSLVIKGSIAIIIGFTCGGIHFYMTVVLQSDNINEKDSSSDSEDASSSDNVKNKTSMEVTALMALIAGRIENEIVIDSDTEEKEGLLSPKLSSNVGVNYTKDKTISLPAKIDNAIHDIPIIELVKLKDKTYPSPNECFQIFKEANLLPPRFLLPPQDDKHIPPHIVALKFISKYNKKNL